MMSCRFIHSSFVYFIRLFLCQPSPLGPHKGTLEIQRFVILFQIQVEICGLYHFQSSLISVNNPTAPILNTSAPKKITVDQY
jgi:hypothetical protein